MNRWQGAYKCPKCGAMARYEFQVTNPCFSCGEVSVDGIHVSIRWVPAGGWWNALLGRGHWEEKK